ncbi:MAG: GspH/FimT family pseudopilin [Gemmatimonadota bacterium]|nr:GspH/FimT family pseudopilin [Gemmatimonadota bacterium]
MKPLRGKCFRSRAGGFTLIELLAVLVVLGILASLAAPAMSAWVAHTKRQAVLDRIATDVAYAKMLAMRSGRPVELRFAIHAYPDCELTSGFGGFRGYAVWMMTDPQREAKRVDLLEEVRGICLAANNFQGGALAPLGFNSRGLPSSGVSPRTIRVRTGARADSIRINAIGRVLRSD